jgi:hypothetical protein
VTESRPPFKLAGIFSQKVQDVLATTLLQLNNNHMRSNKS